jgi:hypothetical protein
MGRQSPSPLASVYPVLHSLIFKLVLSYNYIQGIERSSGLEGSTIGLYGPFDIPIAVILLQ